MRNLVQPTNLEALELKEDEVERRVPCEIGDERVGRILAELRDPLLGLRRELGV